jgi:UDP-glucose:(heptosyl)LPS alpha-1,3-glucosyltransferase
MEEYIDQHPASASIGVDGRSSSHNEIMDAVSKRGLLGVLAILLLYLIPLAFFVNVVRNTRDPTVQHLGLAGGGLVLTMILCGITEAPVMNVRVGTTYAFLLIFLYRALTPTLKGRDGLQDVEGNVKDSELSRTLQVLETGSRIGSIHLVRRYGPVGGMELYVWELTHALAARGHPVRVICEQQDLPGPPDQLAPGIDVHALGVSRVRKPRWLGLLDYDRRASAWLRKQDTNGWVIHSHERTRSHHATTFHGPSIHSRRKKVMDTFSMRLRAWEWLERRELEGPGVAVIYPVSDQIGETLRSLYPGCRDRIAEPAYPGVHPRFSLQPRTPGGKVIGFIGVEWERKGLDLLAVAVRQLRREDPEVRLSVAGCPPAAIRHLFNGWEDGVEMLGWIDPVAFYRRVNVLVLPARNEPYGMVVAEANATGLPVVVSDHCGISPLIDESRGVVVSLGDDKALREACRRLLQHPFVPPPLGLSWLALADRHALDYASISAESAARVPMLAGAG